MSPVDDHPVHESTIKTSHHPGCFDRPPFNDYYWAPDGHTLPDDKYLRDRVELMMEKIQHTMTTECQAAKQHYKECEGCKHQDGSTSSSTATG